MKKNKLIGRKKIKQCVEASDRFKASELRYRRLFETAQDGVLLVDAQTGMITDVNPYLINMLGYSKKLFLKKYLWEVGVFKNAIKSKSNFRELQLKKYIRYDNLPLETGTGKQIAVEFVANEYSVGNEKVIQCNIRDITDRKLIEEKNRENEQRLKIVTNNVTAAVFSKDADRKYDFINSVGARIIGLPKSKIIGKTVDEVFSPQNAKIIKSLDRLNFKGREVDAIRKLKIKDKEVFLRTRQSPVFGKHKKVTGISGIVVDITDDVKKDQLIKDNEERYRLTVKKTGHLIYDYFIDSGKIIWSGAVSSITGFSEQEFGRFDVDDWLRLIHPEDRARAELELKKAQRGHGDYDIVYRFHKKNDGYLFVEDHGVFIFDKRGKAVRMLGVMKDITEKQKLINLVEIEKEKIRNYLDLVGMIIINLDRVGRVTLINRFGAKVLGYKPEEIIGKKWVNNFVPTKQRREVKKVFISLLRKEIKPIRYFENLVVTKSGEEKLIAWNNTFVKDDEGKITSLLSSGEDITNKKIAEDKLIDSESRLRAIFESSPVAIVLVGLDGYFIKVNPAAIKFWGYSETELKKLTFGEITHPEEVKRDIGKVKDLFSGKINAYNVTKRYIRKDKEIVWGLINVTLIRDNEKKPLYFLTIIEDVTLSRQQEEARLLAEKKYEILVENSNDGVVVIQDGNIKFANQAISRITGFDVDEVIGKPLMYFIAPRSRRLVMGRYKSRMAGKEVEPRYEIYLLSNQSKVIPVDISASLINFEGKAADLAIIRDISRAKEIDIAKSEFISVASHQLRTPLTGIKWFAELLATSKTEHLTGKQKEYVGQIASSNERMIKLVNDLLDVSHIETGKKFDIVKKKADIGQLIRHVISEQSVLAQAKKIELVLQNPPTEKLFLLFDWQKLDQTLGNLIGNAIKYSGDGKKVIVGFKSNKNQAEIFVRDFGLGIPRRQQHRIFEKFFRADNIIHAAPEGTGLGLYIARGIVIAHGGRIWFKSKENEGTTFYFSLPLS